MNIRGLPPTRFQRGQCSAERLMEAWGSDHSVREGTSGLPADTLDRGSTTLGAPGCLPGVTALQSTTWGTSSISSNTSSAASCLSMDLLQCWRGTQGCLLPGDSVPWTALASFYRLLQRPACA